MNQKVSIIIPSRNEKFLQATIDDLLAKAAGEVEILAVLDGWWPDPPLRDDARMVVLHRGEAQGMRPAINDAAQIATGRYLMKCDAHCMFAEGYDEALKSSCDEDWLMVPTRHAVDAETWTMKPRHWNHHYLTYPYLPSQYGAGLHAVTPAWDVNKIINAQRAQFPLDDLMSFQGSCWFQHTANFLRLGPLDHENYYFYQEAQEIGLRQWMTGGKCVLNTRTWYAHYHKGNNAKHTSDGRVGRGFYLDLRKKRRSEAYSADFWVNDRHPGATRTFVSLVEQFWWLIEQMTDPRYAWPSDWRDFAGHRDRFEARPSEALPEHIG